MIAKLIEPFWRTLQAVMLADRVGMGRGKVMYQCPGANRVSRGRQATVEVLDVEQMPVHPLHEPIQESAGTVSTGKVISSRERSGIGTQFGDFLPHKLGQALDPESPFLQTTQTLGEGSVRSGLIATPKPIGKLAEQGFELFLGAVPQADIKREKITDHYKTGK